MRIPRWTVWPALAVLIAFVVPAIPNEKKDHTLRSNASLDTEPTKSDRPVPPAKHKRVVVLGFDGMDPDLLEETLAKFPDRSRAWSRLVAQGGMHRLRTTTPPQSPVAWSSFITGLDPGGHGIFDFIHRDPMTRDVAASTTKSSGDSHIALPGDWWIPLGGDSLSNRSGTPFWQTLSEHGIPADIWRMPANFPVEPSKGWSFSGMMTPAIDSAYGEYHLYTTDPPPEAVANPGKIEGVRRYGERIDAMLRGPSNPFRKDGERVSLPLKISIDSESRAAALELDGKVLVLQAGQWSDFVRVQFPLVGAHVSSVAGIVRFYLRSLEPVFELYASPINIDPLDPIAPVSAPKSAAAEVARAIGLYYTQGMPEDVNALKDRALSDAEFVDQSQLVHDEGVRMLDHALDRYLANTDGGFLFFYFSGVDLCSHMLWQHTDPKHPFYNEKLAQEDTSAWSHRPGSTWKDIIYDLYLRMDPVLARLQERLPEDTLLIVMSDHGFASWERKFNLNTWLADNGYLAFKPGHAKELARNDPKYAPEYLNDAVDWTKTRAYGVGFNALYLNLAGREQDDPKTPESEAGIVERGSEADALVLELKTKLEALRDGSARPILRCDLTREIYHGARVAEAPDLIVGYNLNYGNSDASTLGRIPHDVFEDNRGGTFNGNHLMAPELVEGLLLTNGRVLDGAHGLEDLTVEILKQYGITPGAELRGHPVLH